MSLLGIICITAFIVIVNAILFTILLSILVIGSIDENEDKDRFDK